MSTNFSAAEYPLDLARFSNIYMVRNATDLRKGIDGYARIIQSTHGLDPFDHSSVFLFTNKRKDKIKALCYNGTGFWLLYHRLGSGKYKWVVPGSDPCQPITPAQVRRLLEGRTPVPEEAFKVKKPRYI